MDTVIDAATGKVIEPARLLMPGGRREHIDMFEGATVRDLLSQIPRELWPLLQVYNHGTLIDARDWDTFSLRAGDSVLITVTPAGGNGSSTGKQIVGAILMIVVSIYAPGWGTSIVGTAFGAASGAVAAAVGVGITMVAGMVISALIAPPSVSTGNNLSASSPKAYSVSGQSNQPRPYGACYVVYGQHKMLPALATNPDVDNFAATSTLSALYDFGLGWLTLRDVRIGDVPIENYHPDLAVHTNSLCDDLRIVPARIGYDQYALVMNRYTAITVRTKKDTYCANLDMQFPKGIFQAAPSFGQLPFWADFTAQWRAVGATQWTEVPLDWYHGAAMREYIDAQQGIQYGLPGWYDWKTYNPATSPADMRAKGAEYNAKQDNSPYSQYVQSKPNPYMRWTYSGAFDEANYFARYPELHAVGWTRGAQEHFESVGSREGRDPGVPAFYQVIYPIAGQVNPYDRNTSPSSIHQFVDMQFWSTDPLVGAVQWIQLGNTGIGSVPSLVQGAPWQFRVLDSGAWDAPLYLRRYPDVAAGGFDAWDHFSRYGAFEGRDPYVWQYTGRAVRLTATYVGPYWMRIFFVFPAPGEYEVQVTRLDKIQDGTDPTINQTSKGAITGQYNESSVILLRSYQYGLPVMPRLRHTMMEMRVTATDQLNGVVQNLSAIVTSVLRVAWYDVNGVLTFGYMETRNPAWIVLDILTSEKNPRPLHDDQIDWPSWMHLTGICDTLRSYTVNGAPYTGPRYTCDIVVDQTMTVKELVESILSGCRSSMVLTTGGKWGVLHDEEKTVPRQLITPANSWGFSGSRTFTEFPHALRVNFINRDNGWTKDEVLVYWDGYNASNASVFETLETFGVTDYPHAWACGRYMLAQGIQRSELFSLTMDVENLLVQRGDMVYVAHDVPKVGGVPARIVDVQGPPGQAITIDHPMAIPPTGYAIRLQDGTTRTGAVWGIDPAGWIVLDFVVQGIVHSDDMIVLGEYTRQVQPYLVQRITPGADLSAELTLCKYAAGVYQADQGALPPWDAGFGQDFLTGTNLVSQDMSAAQTLFYVAREPRVAVVLRWTTTGWAFDHHELTVILPSGERRPLNGVVVPTTYTWEVDALRERQFFEVTLQFEVVPVSTLGARGAPAYSAIVLQLDKTAPAPVLTFGVNVQKENVDLFWQPPDEPDIAYYAIRYTPQVEVPNWEASQLLVTAQWPANKSSAGARTGSYGIRVVDTSGNQSPVVWRRTTVAVLPDINVITVLNDRDLYPIPWPGKKSHVIRVGREVQSEGDFGAVYPEGIYYCSYPVDLGDVYEVRVTSKVEAYGITADDFMSAWPTLAEVSALARASSAMWDAWLEVRTADEMAMMDDWLPSISAIDPIATGNESEWSAWRPVQVGDFTARLLQFRIRLQSKNPGVRVVVSSGRIEVDMPDRIDRYGDVQVPAAGLDFFFPVAFRVLSAVAITIDGNADPVVAVVTQKEPTGLHVVLKNTVNGVMTAGQIDIMAQGYGRKRLTSI